jgi:4-amino-4-deoxy-L-arabinose transferase-like glycosyltransferase
MGMRRNRLVLVSILIVGLGVRFGYLATTRHNTYATSHDGEIAHNIVAYGRWFVYNERAREFVDEERLDEYPLAARLGAGTHNLEPDETDFFQFDKRGRFYPEIGESIGSSAVLAGLWEIAGGERYWPLQALQAIVDALVALLVYRIAMRLFDIRRVATIAAILYALYPPIAWFTTIPYNDLWAADFTVAIVSCYLEAVHSGYRWRWLVICGLCAGVGSYFRPNVLLVPVVLVLATVAFTGWREASRRGACILAVAALLVVPWTIRNYEDFHAFIPGTSSLWENMWNGLSELPNDFGATTSVGKPAAQVRRVRPDLRVESPAWDSYLKGWVVNAIERHPVFYLEEVVRRAARATLWKHDEIWMSSGVRPILGYPGGVLASIVNRPLDLLEDVLEPMIFLLAMLALVLTWRRWRRQHLILIAVVLSVLVPYILIHVEGRYILPAEFVYFIWIGLGAHLLLERIPSRSRSASRPAVERLRPSTAAR